jgi:hypothetical protein
MGHTFHQGLDQIDNILQFNDIYQWRIIMELKFKRTSSNLFSGILGFLIAVATLCFFIYIFATEGIPNLTNILSIEMLLLFIISIIFGVYNLKLPNITYIKIEDQGFRMHIKLFRPILFIKYDEIIDGKITDGKMILKRENKSDVIIFLQFLTEENVNLLINELRKIVRIKG